MECWVCGKYLDDAWEQLCNDCLKDICKEKHEEKL